MTVCQRMLCIDYVMYAAHRTWIMDVYSDLVTGYMYLLTERSHDIEALELSVDAREQRQE